MVHQSIIDYIRYNVIQANAMLSNTEIKQWLDGFDPDVQGALKVAAKLEEWVLDDDPDIQSLCDLISKAILVEKTDLDTGEVTTYYDYSLIKHVSLPNLSVLQSQLSIIRSIKLFGDICYADPDRAISMLNLKQSEQESLDLSIATKILIKRINLLISMQLIQRIFADDRRRVVIDALKNVFNSEESKN